MLEVLKGYKVIVHESGYTRIVGYFVGNVDGYLVLEDAEIQGTKKTVKTPFVAINDAYYRHISVVGRDRKSVSAYDSLEKLILGKSVFVQLICGDRIEGTALKCDGTHIVLKNCQLITVKLSKKKLKEVKFTYPLMMVPHTNVAHLNALVGGVD